MLDRERAMSSAVDVLFAPLNASCSDCWEQAPPSAILGIPPPPLPLFLQRAFNVVDADPTELCTAQCDWNVNVGLGNVEYVELPRQAVSGPPLDDTWLLVLVATCGGILLLGILLALFLLKAKIERGGKGGVLQLDVSTLRGRAGKATCEAVLYPCPGPATPDPRILWAALTPRGTTQHFTEPRPLPTPIATGQLIDIPSFDNSGFVDSDDPTYAEPLTPVYSEPMPIAGPAEGGTMRRCATLRPTVSSPTRIEHPNFTPLNMLHGNHRSMRRAAPSRKGEEAVVL